MAFSAYITLTLASTNTGPLFDLYSDIDSYTSPFEVDIPKSGLTGTYLCNLTVPDYTSVIRVQSKGTCVNYIDITLNS